MLFRRDPSITMDYQQFARQDHCGRPYVAPEWQLLFKAKQPRPKDDKDFTVHKKRLGEEGIKWMLNALKKHQPNSDWIPELERGI